MESEEIEKDYDILARQQETEMYYDRQLLYKYHKVSELSAKTAREGLKKTLGIDLGTGGDDLQGIGKEMICFNIFASMSTKKRIKFYGVQKDQLSESELLKLSTLFCIAYRYYGHEYGIYFVKQNETGGSDQEVKNTEAFMIDHAYQLVKRLKNLMEMQSADHRNTSATFNMYRQEKLGDGTIKDYIIKENQIVVRDSHVISKMTEILIGDTLESIFIYDQNPYLGVFFQYEENRNLQSVTERYESLKAIRTPNGKQPSAKAVFKGYIYRLVRKFILDEELTCFSEYDYQAKLLAYEIMAGQGLIELSLINSHVDRNARAKYIDSLPKWTGEAILPANITIIPWGGNP